MKTVTVIIVVVAIAAILIFAQYQWGIVNFPNQPVIKNMS